MPPKTPPRPRKRPQKRPLKSGRPKKPRSEKPKRPTRLNTRRKIHPAQKLLLVGVLFCILLSTATYLHMDEKVKRRLQSLEAGNLPVIYSAPLDLQALTHRLNGPEDERRKILRSVFSDRRYSEVSRQPTRPGEYAFQDGNVILFAREFRSPSGAVLPAKKVTLKLSGNSIEQPDTRLVQEGPLLEPQIISYIGAGEVRASKFTPLADIPLVVQQAVISTEDERFFSHGGIDILGILRAAFRNVVAGRLVQGGSTITQQLAKNLFLSPKKTFTRKFLEIPTALSLERRMNKQQLLELYLNEVYLGQEGAVAIHGLPQAAGAFFGKQITDVTADEAAVLAGMIKAPSYFNPRKHPERARERRNVILAKMEELGILSSAELTVATKRPLRVASQQEYRRVAPYFTSALEAELSTPLDLDNAQGSGLAIHTGLDLSLQRCAESAIATGLERLEKNHPKLASPERRIEAALVALDPQSGLVKSWVGGRDFGTSQFNRVSQATRQIGSTVKPFLYLAALDGSLNSYKIASASSILEDKPIEIAVKHQKVWSPENYDHDYRGDVTLRYALENSLNMPALYISERIGLPALRRTVSSFRLADRVTEVPSLALGALDSNLLRLTSAYGALANSGTLISPRLYVSALGDQGERLATAEISERRVADESATFVLTSILQGVIDRGTGKRIREAGYQGPAAGKTGTSDNSRDAWFIGYTPTLVTGVWIGFDDNTPTGLTGGAAAAPVWGEFMRCASPFISSESYAPPPRIVFVDIDRSSGGLFTEDCPESHRFREAFIEGTEPHRLCSEHSSSPASEEEPETANEKRPPPGKPPRQTNTTTDRPFWSSLLGR